MSVGDIVKYEDWVGIVVATSGHDMDDGEEVLVQWNRNDPQHTMREPVCLLEVISSARR